jgi:hypothetical protein
MAPAKLAEVVPTKEEDEESDRILAAADAKQKHSITTAMSTFTKRNADAIASMAEGPLKQKFIKQFVVLQIRAKNSTKKMQSAHTIDVGKTTMIDTVPWNRHKIYKEMGDFKGDLFMGMLTANPCRLSGSTHEEAVEYDIPMNWHRFTHADMNQLKLQNEGDAKPEDAQLIEDLAKLGTKSSSSGTDQVVVKQEPKSAEDIAAEEKAALMQKVNSLRDAPDMTIRKFQDLKIDITKVKGKAELKKSESKYASMVVKDSEKVLDAIGHLLPQLEKLLVKKPTDKGMMQVLEGIDALNVMNDDLQEWAAKLGFASTVAKSTNKRRRKEDVHEW